MRVYKVIKEDVEGLITELEKFENTSEQFYTIRDWDRDKDYYLALSDVKKSARTLYLNKTCFNGLYRVNSAGEFNSPFGNYHNPNIINAPVLRAVSTYFNSIEVHMTAMDYADVYLDPPYDPVSRTSNFTSYTRSGFSREDQVRLRKYCDILTANGIKFMLSNSAADFILDQYTAYNITIVQAKRIVNSVASKRGNVNEVVVRNYE